jgi:hypothetical protein
MPKFTRLGPPKKVTFAEQLEQVHHLTEPDASDDHQEVLIEPPELRDLGNFYEEQAWLAKHWQYISTSNIRRLEKGISAKKEALLLRLLMKPGTSSSHFDQLIDEFYDVVQEMPQDIYLSFQCQYAYSLVFYTSVAFAVAHQYFPISGDERGKAIEVGKRLFEWQTSNLHSDITELSTESKIALYFILYQPFSFCGAQLSRADWRKEKEKHCQQQKESLLKLRVIPETVVIQLLALVTEKRVTIDDVKQWINILSHHASSSLTAVLDIQISQHNVTSQKLAQFLTGYQQLSEDERKECDSCIEDIAQDTELTSFFILLMVRDPQIARQRTIPFLDHISRLQKISVEQKKQLFQFYQKRLDKEGKVPDSLWMSNVVIAYPSINLFQSIAVVISHLFFYEQNSTNPPSLLIKNGLVDEDAATQLMLLGFADLNQPDSRLCQLLKNVCDGQLETASELIEIIFSQLMTLKQKGYFIQTEQQLIYLIYCLPLIYLKKHEAENQEAQNSCVETILLLTQHTEFPHDIYQIGKLQTEFQVSALYVEFEAQEKRRADEAAAQLALQARMKESGLLSSADSNRIFDATFIPQIQVWYQGARAGCVVCAEKPVLIRDSNQAIDSFHYHYVWQLSSLLCAAGMMFKDFPRDNFEADKQKIANKFKEILNSSQINQQHVEDFQLFILKTLKALPFNIDITVDGLTAELHQKELAIAENQEQHQEPVYSWAHQVVSQKQIFIIYRSEVAGQIVAKWQYLEDVSGQACVWQGELRGQDQVVIAGSTLPSNNILATDRAFNGYQQQQQALLTAKQITQDFIATLYTHESEKLTEEEQKRADRFSVICLNLRHSYQAETGDLTVRLAMQRLVGLVRIKLLERSPLNTQQFIELEREFLNQVENISPDQFDNIDANSSAEKLIQAYKSVYELFQQENNQDAKLQAVQALTQHLGISHAHNVCYQSALSAQRFQNDDWTTHKWQRRIVTTLAGFSPAALVGIGFGLGFLSATPVGWAVLGIAALFGLMALGHHIYKEVTAYRSQQALEKRKQLNAAPPPADDVSLEVEPVSSHAATMRATRATGYTEPVSDEDYGSGSDKTLDSDTKSFSSAEMAAEERLPAPGISPFR